MATLRRLFVLLSVLCGTSGIVMADEASRAIVDKAIERMGGEKLLGKFNGATSKLKGTLHLNGVPLPFTGEITSQLGVQQRIWITIEVDGQTVSYTSVLDRDHGWQKINDNINDMSTEQLADAKDSAYSAWILLLTPLKDEAFQLSPYGETEIGGRKVVGVSVAREKHRLMNLFFDKETFSLVRTESIVRDELTLKDVTEETNFSDFKAFDEIQRPSKVVIKRAGQPHIEVEVQAFKPAEKLEESLFAKP